MKHSGGAVAASQAEAAEAALAVLDAGGNAFDALIAAAFCQMVVDPLMCGPGGSGSAVLFRPGFEPEALRFHSRCGELTSPTMWADSDYERTELRSYAKFADQRNRLGWSSVLVPGTLVGLERLHASYGSWPWGDLLAPAVRLADDGFFLPDHVRGFVHPEPGLDNGMERLTRTEECANVFLRPDGTAYREGQLFRNPALSTFLDRVAESGSAALHGKDTAEAVALQIQGQGGFVTATDLISYEPLRGPALKGSFGDMEVFTSLPPDSGPILLEILHIVEELGIGGETSFSAGHLTALACAMRAGHIDRNDHLGDPRFADVLVPWLVSRERAKEWADAIRMLSSGRDWPTAIAQLPESPTTTHLTVWDGNDNIAALTHSIGTGSGVVLPGCGFMFNNQMKLFDPSPTSANRIQPGKSPATGSCPTIVFRDGRPVMALGAAGGSSSLNGVAQAVINTLVFGLSLQEAILAPRLHSEGREHLFAEVGVSSRYSAAFEQCGFTVRRPTAVRSSSLAVVNGIELRNGRLQPGVDVRRGGVGLASA